MISEGQMSAGGGQMSCGFVVGTALRDIITCVQKTCSSSSSSSGGGGGGGGREMEGRRQRMLVITASPIGSERYLIARHPVGARSTHSSTRSLVSTRVRPEKRRQMNQNETGML